MEKIRRWKMIKWIHITDPIYKKHFHLCYGGECKDFVAFINDDHGEGTVKHDNSARGITACIDGPYFYVWIADQKNPYDVLAHELVHFMFMAINDSGITYHDHSEEAYAYYYEYVYSECSRELNRLMKKK